MVSHKEFLEKVDFEKIQQTTKSMQNYTVGKDLKINVAPFECHLQDIHIYEHTRHEIHLFNKI